MMKKQQRYVQTLLDLTSALMERFPLRSSTLLKLHCKNKRVVYNSSNFKDFDRSDETNKIAKLQYHQTSKCRKNTWYAHTNHNAGGGGV